MSAKTKDKARSRSTNYSTQEKLLLMNIVAKYKNIVECKKTNGTSWTDKNAAWDKITVEFNSQSPSNTPRDKGSLRKCYENKKREVRQLTAENRQGIRATGGGKFVPKEDPCWEVLMEITNKKTIEGFPDLFGGDATSASGTSASSACAMSSRDTAARPATFTWRAPARSTFVTSVPQQESPEHVMPGPSATEDTSDNDDDAEFETIVVINDEVPAELSNSQNTDPVNLEKENWGSYKANDLKRKPSKQLLGNNNRRRPKFVQPVHTNYLSQQYSEVANLKDQYLRKELQLIEARGSREAASAANREEREQEEFELRKKSLQLDIEIKQLQWKKLKTTLL